MLNRRPVRPTFLLLERFTRLAHSLHIPYACASTFTIELIRASTLVERLGDFESAASEFEHTERLRKAEKKLEEARGC